MPVICWGPLAKSAQDPTTIAEYIAGKILEHNVDPSAHNLDSYALYNHRDSYPLDHPDYSITSNKITSDWIVSKRFSTANDVGATYDGVIFDPYGIRMYQKGVRKVNIPISGDPFFAGNLDVGFLTFSKHVIMTFFDSVDGWGTENGVGYFGAGLVYAYVEGDLDNSGSIYLEGDISAGMFDFGRNPFFQIDFYSDYSDDHAIDIFCGKDIGVGPKFFGFRITDGVFFAINTNGIGETSTPIPDIIETVPHRFKAIMTSGSKIEFYVDGQLKATHTTNLPTGDNENPFTIVHNPDVGDSILYHIARFLYVEDWS